MMAQRKFTDAELKVLAERNVFGLQGFRDMADWLLERNPNATLDDLEHVAHLRAVGLV